MSTHLLDTTATAIGHETILGSLLMAGTNVSTRSSLNDAALKTAAVNGHKTIVDILLKAGAVADG